MPSKSKKQRRFMAAAANNPKFAKKVGIKPKVAKEFHNADKRQKYAGGGLAEMARGMYAQRGGGQYPPPQGRAGMMNRTMQRPPPRGGLATATKPLPSRIAPPPGKQPGGVRPSVPPGPGLPGNRPGNGPLSRYAGTRGSSGPTRRPQQAPGGQSRVTARIPGERPGNDLLRTAGNASQHAGNRLNHMMGRMGGGRRAFAKGGSIAKAVKALREAKSQLQDSDPDFDYIAELLEQDVPEARDLATRIKATAAAEPKTGDPDEFREAWQAISQQFDDLEADLSPSTFENAGDISQVGRDQIEQIRGQNFPERRANPRPPEERLAMLSQAQGEADRLKTAAGTPEALVERYRALMNEWFEMGDSAADPQRAQAIQSEMGQIKAQLEGSGQDISALDDFQLE